MVFCVADPERRASKQLEKKIAFWMKEYNRAIKLLLLGAGESGKTTIIKQMKILHISGFSEEEKQEKASDIRSNLLESITTLVTQAARFNVSLDCNKATMNAFSYISQINLTQPFDFPQEFYNATEILWKNESIQSVYRRQDQYQLLDCAKYFLDKVAEVRQSSYKPSAQDILHSRRKTTDIQKIEFDIKVPKKYGGGTQTFWMFDVGGQRGERKKWIQVFDGIQAVLFLVSASCFDLVLREDEETNRLAESLEIFESVWSSRFLRQAGFILFLNKQDKLREKVIIEGKSIGDFFVDYKSYCLEPKDSDPNESEEYLKTRCFVRDLFMEIARKPRRDRNRFSLAPGFGVTVQDNRPRECYAHFTTATDTNNVKYVFNDVHSMIIMWNLSDIGIN